MNETNNKDRVLRISLFLSLDQTIKLAYSSKLFYEYFFSTKEGIPMFELQKRFLG